MKKIVLITGIRPNIVKAFSLYRALLQEKNFKPILIHTNQHSGKEMFKLLWNEFKLPRPEVLNFRADNNAERLGKIVVKLSKKLNKIKPNLVVVFGDGDSTLAGALVASKLQLPLAHVEAGLRSFDRAMPEEYNRTVTDHLSDFLFTTEYSGERNLGHEGIPRERIFFVGNTMIDTLKILKEKIDKKDIFLEPKSYILLTIHRPSNVDNKETLQKILKFLKTIRYPIVFPIHPRTRSSMKRFGLLKQLPKQICLLGPLSYLDFLALESKAFVVLTDSGGVQEETTFLNVPCLTLRKNTERPVTLSEGSNSLILSELNLLISQGSLFLEKFFKKKGTIPELWDGQAGKRIVKILKEKL